MAVWDWLRRLFGVGTRPPEHHSQPVPHRPSRPPGPPRVGPADERLLQFSGAQRGPTRLIMGFDFGTSCSKVVIQSPYAHDRRSVPIDFEELGHSSSSYLLPCVLHREVSGSFSLRNTPECAQTRTDLKLRLIRGASPTEEDLAWAAAFLGLAIREARGHFLRTQADIYGAELLRWSLNVGVPSASFDDAAINGPFLRAARAGWRLSVSPSPPTLETAVAALAFSDEEGFVSVDIDAVPEVAAEVVGYARSAQRRDGLHVIVDVGAATIDVCGFVLHEQQGDLINTQLVTMVRPLGLLALHEARMREAGELAPFDRFPDDLVQPIPDWDGLSLDTSTKKALRRCDDAYVEECARRLLMQTLVVLKRDLHPMAAAWEDGLPVFVLGGGSRARVVERIAAFANRVAAEVFAPYKGFRRMAPQLPWDPQETEARADLGARLSVAYGLSFEKVNIPVVHPPENGRPMSAYRPSNWQQRFVDKDQV